MKLHSFLITILSMLLLASCGNESNRLHFSSILEGTAVQIPALTGGQISKMYVDTGRAVESGDTIAVIDTVELSLNRQKLIAGLEEMDSQMQQADIALKQAQADLDYVKERYERTATLYQKNTATQQTLDDVSNQLKKAQTQHASSRQNIRTLTAKKEQLSSELKLIRKKISDAIVLSPRNGIISTRYFEPGEAVPPMNPVAEIIDLDTMDVKIYIQEKMLPHIKYGQKVSVHIDGLSKDITGKISWIGSKAEFTPKSVLTPETRTSLVYAVNVRVANSEQILKHGMPVEVVLEEFNNDE